MLQTCFALVDSIRGVTLCVVLNKVARCWALVSLAWGPTFDIFFPMKVAIKGAEDAAGIKRIYLIKASNIIF